MRVNDTADFEPAIPGPKDFVTSNVKGAAAGFANNGRMTGWSLMPSGFVHRFSRPRGPRS